MATISWIKNDKLKTMNTLIYTLCRKKEAYEVYSTGIGHNSKEYIIPKDVELISFRDYDFNGALTTTIQCENKDTIVIIENCNIGHRMNFNGGNVVLERPIVIDDENRMINFFGTNEVELNLADESIPIMANIEYFLKNVDALSVTGDARCSRIAGFTGSTKMIKLNNIEELVLGSLIADNIEINNSTLAKIEDIRYKSLRIKGSKVEIPFWSHLRGEETEVDVSEESSSIEGDSIYINDINYRPEETGRLSFTPDGLGNGNLAVLHTRLISDLKAIRNEAENIHQGQMLGKNQQVRKIYEPELQLHRKAIEEAQSQKEYYANLIVEHQAIIDEINIGIKSQTENIKNELAKQKIKNIVWNNSDKTGKIVASPLNRK